LVQVVLSFDVLGNPVGVVSALGTGVKDFFLEPAAARSPLEFGLGVGKGSLSLLSHTVVSTHWSAAII
jgi:vacuolar protein sorting-associated protein 13A/C